MKIKHLFREEDFQRVNKEIDCYGYCLNNAIDNYLNADFERAAAYHENAARSLRALQDMKHKEKGLIQ